MIIKQVAKKRTGPEIAVQINTQQQNINTAKDVPRSMTNVIIYTWDACFIFVHNNNKTKPTIKGLLMFTFTLSNIFQNNMHNIIQMT